MYYRHFLQGGYMKKYLLFIYMLLSLIFLHNLTFAENEPQPRHILVLNAYHFNYEWTFNQNIGINKTIADAYPDAIIYNEFLDWKRFADEDLLIEQASVLGDKYKNIEIDLILTTDDKGLIFAMDYRKAYFDDAPIAFSGIIEHTALSIIGDEKNITGVYENMSPSGALDLMDQLMPKLNRIVVIHDLSESGLRTYEAFSNDYQKHKLAQSTVVEDWSEFSFDALIEKVPLLDSNTAIMLISYNISSDGFLEKPEIFGELLSAASSVPIFSVDEFLLNHGIAGGTFLSGVMQGEALAKLGIQILEGTSPDRIPHVKEATVYSAVDENQLLRFDLDKKVLPKEVRVLNAHFSFFETYKNIVVGTLLVFSLLILYILMMFINIQRRKKSENEIRKQKIILQELNEQLAISEEELRAQNESLQDYQGHLEHIAKHDALTTLPNRMYLEEYLSNHLDRPASLPVESFAVVFIDLDNFKFINNTYGHHFGDHVLKIVSERLAEVNTDQFTARIGGDEFILVIKNTILENETLENVFNRIKYAFSLPLIIGKEFISISASIGYSLYPQDGSTSEELIMQADLSMYNAKKSGKSKYMHYDKSMSNAIENDHLLISHIKNAYENKEFVLHYQPQINANTDEIIGFEALLRWYSKDYGYIPPSKIIPLAESTGLIIPIGLCIIEQSIQFALEMKKTLSTKFKVSINISVVQLLENSFEDELFERLNRYQLEPQYIQLEITESVLIETSGTMIIKLNSIREKGISISLDDFGTGFSSLTYLQKLPINEIKIDKSFIDEMLTDSKPAKLVDTILYLAKELNLNVIAEGVETKEQQDYLLKHGCNIMQGYYNSKPLPIEEVVLFCEKRTR